MQGLRALLENLITLVFEQVRRGDDLLLALLDGPPAPDGIRLPNASDVQVMLNHLAAGSVQPSAKGDAMSVWLREASVRPAELLRKRLNEWQRRLARKGPDLESIGFDLGKFKISADKIKIDGGKIQYPRRKPYDEWYSRAQRPLALLRLARTVAAVEDLAGQAKVAKIHYWRAAGDTPAGASTSGVTAWRALAGRSGRTRFSTPRLTNSGRCTRFGSSTRASRCTSSCIARVATITRRTGSRAAIAHSCRRGKPPPGCARATRRCTARPPRCRLGPRDDGHCPLPARRRRL